MFPKDLTRQKDYKVVCCLCWQEMSGIAILWLFKYTLEHNFFS